MMLGVYCPSECLMSIKLAGFSLTAEESSTWVIRPPARPRLKAPAGELRKPSPEQRPGTKVATDAPSNEKFADQRRQLRVWRTLFSIVCAVLFGVDDYVICYIVAG